MPDGSGVDPLRAYDEAFDGVGDAAEVLRHQDGSAALRFTDPEGRRDRAGRPIPHEFVLFPPLSERVRSMDDALTEVWPLVRDRYAAVWDRPTPPAA
ncbi:hypothetical protein [Curtobacterium aurantiacum]|uniref:hypothetical protein n=1 Tax=Curtobacterium aurantiacum TaxID=3236919 RepID=UPI002032A6B9|nr:hypothetical protein [Curtobacterium flaccumfaciens]